MRLTALFLFLAAPFAPAAAPEPEWVAVAPVRECVYRGAGKLLADVDSRLDRWGAGQLDSAGYGAATHAHEGTHMVNAMARNAQRGGGVNAFYCLHGKAVVVREPRTTIRRAASYVPAELRGGRFDLYLRQQAGAWNDRPLYLLDEWSAYTNEAEVVLDQAAAGLSYEKQTDTCMGEIEFVPYVLAVMKAIEADDPKYLDTADGKNLARFVGWNIERAFRQYDACQRVPGLAWKENVRATLVKSELATILTLLTAPPQSTLPAAKAPPQSTLKNPLCPCRACGCDGCDCKGGKCLCPSCMAINATAYDAARDKAVREGAFLVTFTGYQSSFSVPGAVVVHAGRLEGFPTLVAVISGPWPGREHVWYATVEDPTPERVKAALKKAKAELNPSN